MNNKEFLSLLDKMVPSPTCPLNYNRDYELLIATLLSAQCTDKRVNSVTKVLFDKYDIFDLAEVDPDKIEDIIRPCGNQHKKSVYISDIAKKLVNDYDGKLPNDREYLESLPGVGRKTANVVLYNIFNEPTFAVDTHVSRVSKRLGIANKDDDVLAIENKLMNTFDKDMWGKLHHQFLLLGRFTCTSGTPKCESCKLHDYCKYYKENN